MAQELLTAPLGGEEVESLLESICRGSSGLNMVRSTNLSGFADFGQELVNENRQSTKRTRGTREGKRKSSLWEYSSEGASSNTLENL